MITVKLSELFLSRQNFLNILNFELKSDIRMKLKRIFVKVNAEYTHIDEINNELVKKYGVADDKGKLQITQQDENWSKFAEEFNAAIDQEISLDIDKINSTELVDFEGKEIKLSTLLEINLNWLFNE